MLGIVTCYFNPCQYRNIRDNYFTFVQSLGRAVTTVELSFNGQFEIPGAIPIHGSSEHVMWQKERLLNLAIAALPECYDKVAWIDADILFLNTHWYQLAEQALEEVPVIQLGSRVHQLDYTGQCLSTCETLASAWCSGRFQSQPRHWFHTGYAWACRRELIAETGLYDREILGGADSTMAFAWLQCSKHTDLTRRFTRGMSEAFSEWYEIQSTRVDRQLGCLQGDLCHLWHGDRQNRRYVERSQWLRQADFDPRVDIAIDDNGLWKWASEKPVLHARVAEYFQLRSEDLFLKNVQENSILKPDLQASG